MAGSLSLDDKLLGEKMQYYCSSSEEEEEESREIDNEAAHGSEESAPSHQLDAFNGKASNTGPKGVIEDWRRFKQLEAEKRQEMDLERLELQKKLSMSCRSHLDDEREKVEDEKLLVELEAMDDDFLEEYRQKRLEEMRHIFRSIPQHGSVVELTTAEQFLEASERSHPLTTVIIHIYEPNVAACQAMNGCLECLCKEYSTVKFCKITSTTVRLSTKFTEEGVPALLVYKKGELIGNLVCLTDVLGDDFFEEDVESLLNSHGHLPCKSTTSQLASC